MVNQKIPEQRYENPDSIKFDLVESFELILSRNSNGKLIPHFFESFGELICDNALTETHYMTLSFNCGTSISELAFNSTVDVTEKRLNDTGILCFKPRLGRHSLLSYR